MFCCDMDRSGLFGPVFIILVGVLILLVNLGLLPPETWRFWPLILILFGLLKLIEPGVPEKK